MSALSKSRHVNINKADSRRIEDETRRMEAKLEMLRQTVDGDAAKPSSAGRWKGGSASKPLTRGYVKGVLDQKPGSGGRSRTQPKVAASAVEMPTEGALGALLGAGGALSDRTFRPEQQPAPAAEQLRSGAAANLQAAVSQQSEESQEVEFFLASLKLDRYASIFLENGFESMDVVQEMQESHMREIGMAVGHIVKLQKRLAELRPQPMAPPARPADAEAGATQRRVSFGATEEAKPAVKVSTTKASTELQQMGDFDEAESAASFQEALRAWRGEGPSKPEPPKAPGSFWSSVGGNEVDLQRCSTPVRAPTELNTADSETQRDVAPSEDKLCCYQCYKQFYKQFAVERSCPALESATPRSRPGTGGSRKLLCSEACADRWVAAMEEKAQAQRKRQEKLDALREAQRAFELQQQGQGDQAVEAN